MVHLEALELLSTECASKVGVSFLDNLCCHVPQYVQVTSEGEAVLDDDKGKLEEQLAKLNDAFTLAEMEEVEEEEEGK